MVALAIEIPFAPAFNIFSACAMELIEIGVMNAMRIEEERRLQFEKLVAYTKQWCEQVIAPMLEKSANEGNVHPSCDLWFTGDNNSTLVRQLYSSGSYYAIKRLEAHFVSEDIHIPTLKEYLAQFCYQLEPQKCHDYRINGCAKCEGYEWKVTVSPSCVQ